MKNQTYRWVPSLEDMEILFRAAALKILSVVGRVSTVSQGDFQTEEALEEETPERLSPLQMMGGALLELGEPRNKKRMEAMTTLGYAMLYAAWHQTIEEAVQQAETEMGWAFNQNTIHSLKIKISMDEGYGVITTLSAHYEDGSEYTLSQQAEAYMLTALDSVGLDIMYALKLENWTRGIIWAEHW